ncbi:MAG: extracellular solute-binding protein [Treponema sp.]|jgi:ABC-type glycerol-3-phosphate transport system substrate-binding protein|nr:extracellular solute-binding protein [Treponema sp.]
MKNRLKIFICILTAAILPAPVFAGGKGETKAGGKPELLVSVWAGPHADLQKRVVQKNTAANVTIDDIDYSNMKQKQLTSFQAAAGSGNYDVVWVNSLWMKEYVGAGYILPIDEYVKQAKLDLGIYAKGLLDGCVFDGKLYGLPTFAQTLIIAYDSEVFQKEGVKVPSNSEELIAAAKYFKQKGTGIALPAQQGIDASNLYSQLLFSEDSYYFDRNGRLAVTSPEAIYAASVYDQLVQYSLDGSLAWHHDEVAEALRMKNTPIALIMSGLANQNHDPERSLIVNTVKYAPLAGKNGMAAATNTFWVWAVARNTKNPAAAADLCMWLASPAVEKEQTLGDSQISAINSLSSDREVLAKAPFLPVVMEQLANGKNDPYLTSFNAFRVDLETALSEIATTGAAPAEVFGRLQKKYENTDFSK